MKFPRFSSRLFFSLAKTSTFVNLSGNTRTGASSKSTNSGNNWYEFLRPFVHTGFALGMGATLVLMAIRSNAHLIYDKPTLANEHDRRGVIDASELEVCGDPGVNAGRSGGSKYKHLNPKSGKPQYFYGKCCGSIDFMRKELFVGSLMQLMMGDSYPSVFLCEQKGTAQQSAYSILSESITYSGLPNMNMETWVANFRLSEEAMRTPPEGIGVAICIGLLFGNTDIKLQNLVNSSGSVYAIDHESSLSDLPILFDNKEQILRRLLEYKEDWDTMQRSLLGSELGNDANINLPLRDDPGLLSAVRSVLLANIQRDWQSGAINRMYQRFAALDD